MASDPQRANRQRALREATDRASHEGTQKVSVRAYSSAQSNLRDDVDLEVFYCSCCGNFALVIDTPLEVLEVRMEDGSKVVDTVARAHKLHSTPGPAVYLKRETGVELQYRLNCEKCHVPIGYRHKPHNQPARFIFLFPGALSDSREPVRPAAFSGR